MSSLAAIIRTDDRTHPDLPCFVRLCEIEDHISRSADVDAGSSYRRQKSLSGVGIDLMEAVGDACAGNTDARSLRVYGLSL